MIRFIAYLLILVSSYLIAVSRCQRLETALSLQYGMLDLIKSIKRSVMCYRLPLSEIVREFEHEGLSEIGFLDDFRQSSFYDSYSRYKAHFCYSAYCEKRLVGFMSEMGSLTLSEQLIACEELISVLNEELEAKKEDYPKRKKLYITLGICAGLSVVILLI